MRLERVRLNFLPPSSTILFLHLTEYMIFMYVPRVIGMFYFSKHGQHIMALIMAKSITESAHPH